MLDLGDHVSVPHDIKRLMDSQGLCISVALGGPTIGAIVLAGVGALLPEPPHGRLPGVATAPVLDVLGVVWLYALILVGPGSAVLGASGAWVLMRQRRRRPKSRTLYLSGVTLGALSGALCLPVSLTIFRLPIAFFSGRRTETVVDLLELTTASWLYLTAGLVAGVALGWLVAFIVDRRGTAPPAP